MVNEEALGELAGAIADVGALPDRLLVARGLLCDAGVTDTQTAPTTLGEM